LLEDGISLEDVCIVLSDNLSLALSQTILSILEQKLAGVNKRENRLRWTISPLKTKFDYIIIDTPPNIGLLTFNALRACREAIIPIDPSYFSLHGVAKLMQTIGLLKETYQQTIRVNALPTMTKLWTKFGREILEDIRKFFKENTCQTTIRNTVKIKEAASYGQSILDYAERSGAAQDYMDLVLEVISEERNLVAEDFSGLLKTAYETGQLIVFDLESPQAQEVKLVGDFNGWSLHSALCLKKQEDGIWRKPLYLDPGKYQYKFVVDGKWITDPSNDWCIRNEFGETNSVLVVEPVEEISKDQETTL
jgi:chromosome partitioning protein